jgi:hypothetical protein
MYWYTLNKRYPEELSKIYIIKPIEEEDEAINYVCVWNWFW